MKHITRIAPSPTGMFHVGSARTALFNYLIAKASGGQFILRIDDTDVARNSPEAEQIIHDAMAWLDLPPDLVFRQSDRLPIYRMMAEALVTAGMARRDGDAIRLTRVDDAVAWRDTLSGSIAITDRDRQTINDMVLLRSDAMPTYHLASVVDDMMYGVTWIVRGTDHLSNTAKHVALWQALSQVEWAGKEARLPLFTHLGMITHLGKKLTKRDGSASLLTYRDEGIDPAALCNWLLRLGWGPTVDDQTTKMISRERALELFLEAGRMRSSPANMDPALLAAFDRKYKGARERAAKAATRPTS